jgi:alpha-D-xyloside xylohydrolase
MAETLRGGLSLGLSGFAFWSHDISGFERTASPPVYKRWCAFGLLSSHSRLHGSESYRVPWLFDDEAVDVLRYFTELKCRLMPYLYATAIEARDHGWPVLRAMLLEFPDDPGAEMLDRQYMLGGALLVAPIFRDDGQVTVYLPKGRWTRLFSGDEVAGEGWRLETHDYFSLPLYVRANTILPFGSVADRPDYDYLAGAIYRVYALDDGKASRCAVVTRDGATVGEVSASRAGDRIRLAMQGIDAASFLLVGIPSASAAAVISSTTAGVLIRVEGSAEIAIA